MTKFYRVMYAIFARPVRALFRIHTVNPEKMPADQGCLICANHTSMLDVLILSAGLGRQIRYMAKKELFGIPGLKQLITALGAYPIDRGGADVASLKQTIAFLEEGELVGIFPQGTRHPGADPSTTPIKSGVGMVAWHAKAAVVPAYIKTEGNRVRPFRRTELILGDPIPFEDLGFTKGSISQYRAASEKVFSEICLLGGYTRPAPAGADKTDTSSAAGAEEASS